MYTLKMSKKDLPLRWMAVILFLLFIGECKSTKRIQRRFMWKDVDHTMDGIFDSMASSARAMKSMFGELMPGMKTAPTYSPIHSSKIFDFLPSETTKIKYIIHTPTTKPMKVLKMSAPKKVIKVMNIPKPIVEVKSNRAKINFGSAAALRQLEKEQELIAEGRQMPTKANDENHKKNNEIVSAKINEFGTDWQPISTPKSYPMSNLYTNILSEPLPQAEKQIYIPENDIPNKYDESRHNNNYEVTEYAPEESVAIPYTQHYENSRGFVPIRSSHHSSSMHQTARSGQSSVATTSTEPPNYPASFLKKHREHPTHMQTRQMKTKPNMSWVRPSNATVLDNKTKPKQLVTYSIKGPNWSVMGPTILPAALELSTLGKIRKVEPSIQPTSDERLRPKSTITPTVARPRDIRQRGSIKFGDKLEQLFK